MNSERLPGAGDRLAPAETHHDRITVLHVDDQPELADLAATFLERVNDRIDVVREHSARDGLVRLEGGDIDCIVSDYDMPGTDGIEFLEAVRESDPDLPFILYTGKGSEEVASDAVSAGVTDYLQKGTGTEQYTLLANRIENAVEQCRSRRALERQRERFRTLVEESSDVMLIVDAFAEISYVTPSAERVLGRTPDQLVGTSGLDPIHPDDVGLVGELFGELVENPGERRTAEFRYQRPDGSYIWAEARGRNLLDDPVIEGIVVYTRDLTDRVERERELKRRNDRLAEFTSIVSHDLRNPLQVAAGRLELVADHELPEPVAENLDAIDDAVDRMERLIDDLLTLAREGDVISGTESVAVADLADDCWTNVATEGGWLVVDTDRTVRADVTRLRQLFENLFRNSVEHVGPDVTVTVGELDDGSGFYVADDGPGIPERERGAIFEFGYSTSDEGTGFGLRIVEQVADAHGWDVHVTESESGGARFEFSGVEFGE